VSEVLFNRAAEIEFTAPNQDSRILRGIRISFSVEKTEEDTPNSAKVTIYNLNNDTRSYLQQKGAGAILSAGYNFNADPKNGSVKVLFNGTIKKLQNKKEKTGIQTSFELIDGISAYTTKRIERSYKAGVTAGQLYRDLSIALGLKVDSDSAIKGLGTQFLRGYAMSGMVKDEMTRLTKATGMKWSIQDGALLVLLKDASDDRDSVVLKNNTGLIGIPNRGENGVSEFTSLLNPKFTPGRRVQIESENLNGIYRITKLQHQGDTHGGPWYSICEAKRST
jgi:hypothetical protein